MHRRRKDIKDAAVSTCTWLLEDPNYREWFGHQSQRLWITETPGAGKSTVMKHTSEAAFSSTDFVCASFFSHFADPLQRSATGLLRCILHQIALKLPNVLQRLAIDFKSRCEVDGAFGVKWEWHESDLWSSFELAIKETAMPHSIRLYIDAVDECETGSAAGVIKGFERFANDISICFSCRHHPVYKPPNETEIRLEQHNLSDIRTYVTQEIGRSISKANVAKLIRDEIVTRSKGNFQWVQLSVPIAIHLATGSIPIKAIRNRLENVPKELYSLYENMFSLRDRGDDHQSLKLMQWMCFACESLTLTELRHCIIMDLDTKQTSVSDLINDDFFVDTDEEMESQIRYFSRGLVEVVQQGTSRIAQFIHQSVHNFLLEHGLWLFGLEAPDNSPIGISHFRLSRSCLKYLLLDEVQDRKKKSKSDLEQQLPFLRYALRHWTRHVEIVEERGISQVDLLTEFQLTSFFTTTWPKTHKIFEDAIPSCPPMNTTMFHFLARHNLNSLLNTAIGQGYEVDSKDDEGRTPLAWAAFRGQKAIAYSLIDRDEVDINAKDKDLKTPLLLAAREGHETIVRRLLSKDGIRADTGDFYGQTPLSWAARRGHETIVRLLVENAGAYINKGDRFRRTPLSWAVEKGHDSVTKYLLGLPNIDAIGKDYIYRTPLY